MEHRPEGSIASADTRGNLFDQSHPIRSMERGSGRLLGGSKGQGHAGRVELEPGKRATTDKGALAVRNKPT